MSGEDNSHVPQDPPGVIAQPVADFSAVPTDEDVTLTRTFPVRWPQEDWNDFQVGVRATVLSRCRVNLAELAADHFPWAEVCLGLTTLSLGATISAWISGIVLSSGKGVILYVIVPMIGSGAGVGYFMLRQLWTDNVGRIAQDLLNDLPDPGRTVSGGGTK
jgi:hypothetical protein